MKLGKLFDLLAAGELIRVNLGDNTTAGVTQYNHAELINHINMGMLKIYTRVPIRVREVVIQEKADINYYKLDPAFAVSNTASTEPVKYILDTPDNLFDDSFLAIDNVYNEFGYQLVVNDRSSGKVTVKQLTMSYRV